MWAPFYLKATGTAAGLARRRSRILYSLITSGTSKERLRFWFFTGTTIPASRHRSTAAVVALIARPVLSETILMVNSGMPDNSGKSRSSAEFARTGPSSAHPQPTLATGFKVYFCDPHSPRQKNRGVEKCGYNDHLKPPAPCLTNRKSSSHV